LYAIATRRILCTAKPSRDETHWPELHQLVSDADRGGLLSQQQLSYTDRLTWDTTRIPIPDSIWNLKYLHVICNVPGSDEEDAEFVSVLARFQSKLRSLVVSYKYRPAFHTYVYFSPAKKLPADLSLRLQTLVLLANIPYGGSLLRATQQSLKYLIMSGYFDDTDRYPELRYLCRITMPVDRTIRKARYHPYGPCHARFVWPKMVLSVRIETPEMCRSNVILDDMHKDLMLDLVNELDDPYCDEYTAGPILIDFLAKRKALVCLPSFIESCELYIQCSEDCYDHLRLTYCNVGRLERMVILGDHHIAIVFEHHVRSSIQVVMVINRVAKSVPRTWI
jgi:hypothetical protein